MAAQFSFTKVRPLRGLRSCTARAINSLPVPVSPQIRTVESVGANRIMGAVLNRIERAQMVGGYGYYDYYGYGSGKDDTARKAERADTARKATMDAA